MNELIYVCSPLRGDIFGNVAKAKDYCRAVAYCGDIPIAPHVYFTTFLHDDEPIQRGLGLAMGLEMLRRCSRIAIFGGPISEGMWGEIKLAKELDMPLEYFKDDNDYYERNRRRRREASRLPVPEAR